MLQYANRSSKFTFLSIKYEVGNQMIGSYNNLRKISCLSCDEHQLLANKHTKGKKNGLIRCTYEPLIPQYMHLLIMFN